MLLKCYYFVEDYSYLPFLPTYFDLNGPNTQVCITITIEDDNIRKHLLEFFNITLLPYDPNTSPTPGYTGLTVDTTPSSIYIQDVHSKLTIIICQSYFHSLEQNLKLILKNQMSHSLKLMVINIFMLY